MAKFGHGDMADLASEGFVRNLVIFALFIAATALALAGALGYCGAVLWWFDLFANFRLHYIMCGAALVLLAAMLRSWPTALAGVVAICVSGFALLQVPVAEPPPGAKGPVLIIGSFNVLFNNAMPDTAVRFAEANQPDIIVFQEFSKAFLPSLDKLRERYPYQAVFTLKKGGTDVVMISRLPLIDAKLVDDPEHWIRVLTAQIELDGARLQLITLHPPTPTSPNLAAIRDRNFAIVAKLVSQSSLPTIVIGDFNATLWSKPVRELFAATQLQAVGRWPNLTFPSTYFWPLRIPIDNVLISPGLSFVEVQTASRFGSDHFPIVARLAIGGRR